MQGRNRGVVNFRVQELEQAGLQQFFFNSGSKDVLDKPMVHLRTGKE
jgi:hypothetical protein